MSITLYDHQLAALKSIKNGCILNGDVGSGKSLTAISYYYLKNGGSLSFLKGGNHVYMQKKPKDLYIITTARKRDKLEWDKELLPFLLSTHPETNYYSNKVSIDSWNNIKKYANAKNAFFIFDEQRVVGYGAWVKAFLKIAKSNDWILLSATPGDSWNDYIPVFIANGFYRNKTEFISDHVIYDYRVKNFPKIKGYMNTAKLYRLRDSILIDMAFARKTRSHHEDIIVPYDISTYKQVTKNRWDPWNNKPISNPAALCYNLRKLVNSDVSRQNRVIDICTKHPKVIIFYNFDYELDILRSISYPYRTIVAEWNGHKHESIPSSERWVYLVQYTAGCEGWNCIETDTMIFYSQNYSYKVLAQASGRIDRLNTPFIDLYYYHLKSKSSIDVAISKAIRDKKKFNESKFTKWN